MHELTDLLKHDLPRLRALARGLARNSADADDLVQTTVVKALAAQHSFVPGTNFQAWIYRILRNEFIDTYRRNRRNTDLDEVPEEYFAREGRQEERVFSAHVWRELRTLPYEYREALLLVAVEELDYAEVAQRLGVAVGTVKSRVFRARAMLRNRLLGGEVEKPAGERRTATRRTLRTAADRPSTSSPPFV